VARVSTNQGSLGICMENRVPVFVGILALSLSICLPLASQTAQQPDTTQPRCDKQPKSKHKGDKDDINAIGNRKIGGTNAGNWYSLESEIRMGREYSQIVDSQVKLVQDPVVSEYVNRIGQNLVRNSDAKVPFTIKVIDSEEVNAFGFPGGFLYVHSGLILAADDEAELAGAMAHEIAHVAARHATRQMTRSNLASLLSLPLIFLGGPAGLAIREAVNVARPLTFLKFSRAFEAEADYLGLEYMYEAGYDPEALISFFEKVQAREHGKPGTLSKAFASHPQTADRVKKSQVEIAKVLPVRDEYLVNTSDFEIAKARLVELENRGYRRGESYDKPTLRRRTATSTADNPNDSTDVNDNDRPVLKRRSQN